MPDYLLFDANISVLTPLHIGSGEELLHEYDYAIYNRRTWRIDEAAVLEAQNVENPALALQLARTPPARLLSPSDFKPGSPYFRYSIQGAPRSSAEGARVREQIKDVRDQPYFPGSSLKGALRTAIAWYAWEQRHTTLETRKLGPNRHWAAQDYERDLLGRDPNHDLLRALQVADSLPGSAENLMIVNVRVVSGAGRLSAPIEVEALRPDVNFQLTFKLDRALFSEWAQQRGLKLRGGEWLANLSALVNQHSRKIMEAEQAWFKEIPAASRLHTFYQQLARANPGAGQMLLQVGWGAGWGQKTFGSRLTQDPEFLEYIIQRYKLARGRRRPGAPFPLSRRAVVAITQSPQGAVETPAYPLGWILLEITPRPIKQTALGNGA